ncbi:UDP-phosphate alpha-4-amino-4-deoxy-L-arabinose arabinosyl transferase [Arenibacter sp. H213]|nr:UDP-phosphate alpha-4-amino-4-deoxy-L-arabinose arabinosyl transferase [Arenibacter sp. H213]
MVSRITTFRYYFLFLSLVFILLISGIGSYGLAETSEARYAEISREMFRSGDYIHPELLGIYHYHKPPLTYYITTLGYRIFGVNEFGARFFLQIAVVLQLLFVYGIANLLFKNKKIAFVSGLIYFSMPIVLLSSRNLTTDAYLTTLILGAIYFWQYYTLKRTFFALYLFYILTAFGLLTKGPVALIFIFTYILTYKILFRESYKMNFHHILGFILCLLLGGSWYFFVLMDNPKLWNYFMEKQLFSRVVLESFHRSKPFWYYIPLVMGLLFPWWLPLLGRYRRKLPIFFRAGKETKLFLYSSIFSLIIFSVFSNKLIFYILPMFWMLAIFLSAQLFRTGNRVRTILNKAFLYFLIVLYIAILCGWLLKPEFIRISYGTVIHESISVAAFMGIYFVVNKNAPFKPAILAASFNAGLLVTATSMLSYNSEAINSTNEMVNFITNETSQRESTIVVYDYLLSSIPFYTLSTQITLKSSHNTTDREVMFQHDSLWRKNLWDMMDDRMIARMDSLSYKPNTFLLIRKKRPLTKNLKFLENHFKYRKEYSKWWILYNH